MNVKDVFLEWVFPLLGGIVGTLMFMAPLKAVLEGTRRRSAALTKSRPASPTLHSRLTQVAPTSHLFSMQPENVETSVQ